MLTNLSRRRVLQTASAAVVLASSSKSLLAEQPIASTEQFGFGWNPDLPDLSDEGLMAPPQASGTLPKRVDLLHRVRLPKPYNQGNIGSCTANAIAGAVQYARLLGGHSPNFIPSRTFIYYYERALENKIYTDSGAQIRNGIKVIVDNGVPPEDLWPYDFTPANATTRVFQSGSRAITEPPKPVKEAAMHYKAISYSNVTQEVESIKQTIAGGFPIVFGFTVYTNFQASTKVLTLPGINDGKTPYGHAVLIVGYDDSKHMFRIRNSWGTTSNDAGYFDMDYDYVGNRNLARDFWVVYDTAALINATK